MAAATLEVEYANIKEIDDFNVESANRRIILELVKPLMDDMDKDRKNVITLDLQITSIVEKVKQLEYLCGVSEAKPKVFQDLDD